MLFRSPRTKAEDTSGEQRKSGFINLEKKPPRISDTPRDTANEERTKKGKRDGIRVSTHTEMLLLAEADAASGKISRTEKASVTKTKYKIKRKLLFFLIKLPTIQVRRLRFRQRRNRPDKYLTFFYFFG